MQSIYTSGFDPNSLSLSPLPIFQQIKVSVKVYVQSIFSCLSLEYIVFKNSSGDWWIKAFDVEQELFPNSHNISISQVVIYKDSVYGICIPDNQTSTSIYSAQLRSGDKDNELDISLIPFVTIPKFEAEGTAVSEGTGVLYLWNSQGILYNIDLNQSPELSISFSSTGLIIQKVVCGFNHNLILTDTGAVYSWGNGSRGQLGHPDIIISSPVPKRIEFFDDLPSTITDIVAGGWHNLALTSDGDIYSWGWNQIGQLGHGNNTTTPVVKDPYPIDLGSSEDPIIRISAGSRHSIALVKSGKVYTWGWNKYGQLGTGDFEDRNEPTEINLSKIPPDGQGSVNIKEIGAGRWSTYVYL